MNAFFICLLRRGRSGATEIVPWPISVDVSTPAL